MFDWSDLIVFILSGISFGLTIANLIWMIGTRKL